MRLAQYKAEVVPRPRCAVGVPGQLGENITTRGVDLLSPGTGTVLRFGGQAAIEATGLRDPCAQIDRFSDGPLKQRVYRGADGATVYRAGMAVVLTDGPVEPGMPIRVQAPDGPHVPLRRV
ncbi:hypothetical protein PWG71_16395 [Nocardiopsis sp. N85]|uniref:MOSC domain-containing protein n=1 Tax=Nocardiopsis sp. N85 TaxID=3029400 RepID=UPI00237F9DF4|nr:MOSC domain-containing protein [Nocardiopsis sp. N85]MDE3722970.1 hypothetical protein [Nocardiopsis sp. N85]